MTIPPLSCVTRDKERDLFREFMGAYGHQDHDCVQLHVTVGRFDGSVEALVKDTDGELVFNITGDRGFVKRARSGVPFDHINDGDRAPFILYETTAESPEAAVDATIRLLNVLGVGPRRVDDITTKQTVDVSNIHEAATVAVNRLLTRFNEVFTTNAR